MSLSHSAQAGCAMKFVVMCWFENCVWAANGAASYIPKHPTSRIIPCLRGFCLIHIEVLKRKDLVDPDSGQQKDVEPSLVATIDIIVSHRFISLNFSEMVSCETITPVKRFTVSRQCNSNRPTRSPREHPARCVQQPGTSVLKHTWMVDFQLEGLNDHPPL